MEETRKIAIYGSRNPCILLSKEQLLKLKIKPKDIVRVVYDAEHKCILISKTRKRACRKKK